jgi:hypothetical protein
MSALLDAAQARHGTTLSAWEVALRAHVQALIEAAVLPLSEAVPDMLDEGGDLYREVRLELPLPAGERLRLVASVEVVE